MFEICVLLGYDAALLDNRKPTFRPHLQGSKCQTRTTAYSRWILGRLSVPQPLKKPPRILWDPNFHSHVHNSSPLQVNPMTPLHNSISRGSPRTVIFIYVPIWWSIIHLTAPFRMQRFIASNKLRKRMRESSLDITLRITHTRKLSKPDYGRYRLKHVVFYC